MKTYSAIPGGVLHFTKKGLVRITHDEKLLIVPRTDERIVSIQGSGDIVIRTEDGKKYRTNSRLIAEIEDVHKMWVHIVPLSANDEVVAAACHGPLWGRDPQYMKLNPVPFTEFSPGSEIILENVPSQSGEQEKGIRVLRYPYPIESPKPDVSMLDIGTIKKFPKDTFTEPNIIVIHSVLMKRAFAADGVTVEEIIRRTMLSKQQVSEFINCSFVDAGTVGLLEFVRWLIKQKYTFNNIAQRDDIKALFENDDSLHSIKRYTKAEMERLSNLFLLYATQQHKSQRQIAADAGIDRETVRRMLSPLNKNDVSDKLWNKLDKFLQRNR